MDVLILRLLLDSSFFMAIFGHWISGDNTALRFGLPAVLVCWLGWLLLNWKKKDLEGRIQDVAMTEFKILAVVQVYEVVMLGFARWQQVCAPYIVIFVVVFILFLRAGRLVGGSQEKGKFWASNGLELLLLLGSVAIFSSETVKNLAWSLLGKFYMTLILPILAFFLNIIQAVFMFLEPWIASFFSGVEFAEQEVELDTRTGQDFLQLTGNEPLAETPLWVKIAGIAIVVVILAIIFFFLYQKLSVTGSGRDRKIKGQVKKTSIGAAERRTEKRRSIFEEKNVRYYYRRFLELCRKNGLEPETASVTSEMMQQIAVENWGEAETVEDLTELYREIRYGGKTDADPERAQAKGWFKTIRSAADKKKKESDKR